MYPNNLTSLQLERNFLGGLINNPQILVDLENIISEKEFANKVHFGIFSVIKSIVLSGQKLERVILSQKIKDLGLSYNNEINIFDYIEDISFTQIQPSGMKEIAQELIKLRIRRDLWDSTIESQNYIKTFNENKIETLISNIDNINNKKINQFSDEDIPVDLFDNIEEIINERAKNPLKQMGFQTQFNTFNEMFSGFRTGISAICGRAKNNKSTMLLNMGWGIIAKDENVKVLYIDTELKQHDHQFRSVGAFSGVNPYYLESGEWVRNAELINKIKHGLDTPKKMAGKLYHYYIGNRTIDETINVIRRWYFSKVGRGNPAVVIYDYIKMGDEKLSNHNQEHQELGRKINVLNELSHNLNIPIITSMQLNRSAITDNREDESAISMTDRLSWFANMVCIIRKKRPDEITDETIQFGTHKLIPVVSRYQGKNSKLFDLVKIGADSRNRPIYKNNFINYNFNSFLFEEKGTLIDIANHHNLQAGLQTNNHHNNHANI